MADIYNYIVNTGVIVPDTSDLKNDVTAEYQEALGSDMNTTAGTPQGRLITAETAARANVVRTNSLTANMFNINLAYGKALDALGAMFGLYREGATSSSVLATITGVSGTVIPANSQASTAKGVIFYLENQVTIPESGAIQATFLSQEKGEIACAIGELNKIIDGTFGWETITNEAPAVLGTPQESDESFKARFPEGIFTGKSLLEDYSSALSKVENLNSSYVYDNYTNEVVTIDGVQIQPHSLYSCVEGGTDEDVAEALFSVKSAGCGYTGNTTVNVKDPVYGNSYAVKFDRPEQVLIDVKVTVNQESAAEADLQQAIIDTILSYASGGISTVQGLKVNVSVSPFEIAGALSCSLSSISVQQVEIAVHEQPLSTAVIPIKVNQIAVITASNITVVIN
jgi:hypothetical protein